MAQRLRAFGQHTEEVVGAGGHAEKHATERLACGVCPTTASAKASTSLAEAGCGGSAAMFGGFSPAAF